MTATPGRNAAPRIIGHRGYSAKAPENTLASIRLAIDTGVDGIEWDVHTASCGTPVLFHDTSLGRTTNGVGPVRRRTLKQLKALDAGGWFDDSYIGETIPTLDEACTLVVESGYAGPLFAEIKGWREMEDVDRMLGVVGDHGLVTRTTFVAMDWTTLDRVARISPDSPTAYVVEGADRWDEGFERARDRQSGIAIDYRLVLDRPDWLDRAAEAEVEIGVWTVDDPTVADRLHALGVRDITTNEVAALMQWKRQLSGGATGSVK